MPSGPGLHTHVWLCVALWQFKGPFHAAPTACHSPRHTPPHNTQQPPTSAPPIAPAQQGRSKKQCSNSGSSKSLAMAVAACTGGKKSYLATTVAAPQSSSSSSSTARPWGGSKQQHSNSGPFWQQWCRLHRPPPLETNLAMAVPRCMAAPIYNFFLWCTWPHPRAPTVQPCRAGSTRPAGQPNCLLIIWEHPFQTLAPTLQATPTSALPTCTSPCTHPVERGGPLGACGAVSGALGQGPSAQQPLLGPLKCVVPFLVH